MHRESATLRTWLTLSLGFISTAAFQSSATGQNRQLPGAESGNGLYSLPRSQDEIATLEEATSELKRSEFDSAVARLQGLLKLESSGVIAKAKSLDNYSGLRMAVIQLLRELPLPGLQAYENLVSRLAGHMPKDPRGISDREALLEWAWNFPCSRQGLDARIRLGDLALIEGDGINAQLHYRAAKDAMPPSSSLLASLEGRRRAADYMVRQAHSLPLDEELAGTAKDLGESLPAGGLDFWPAYGGYEGTRPMTAPVGQPQRIAGHEVHASGFEMNPFAMHLTGDLSAVYVNNGLQLEALSMLERGNAEVLWRAPGPMLSNTPSLSRTRNGINHSLVLSAAISPDIVVAALQVPYDLVGASDNQRFRGGVEIIQKLPARRLFAFDRSSGKRVWAHWDFRDGPIANAYEGHEAASPPVIFGDTVYVASHQQTGAITFYLYAYDLYSGATKWRRLICTSQQEVNMFGNANMEFVAAPLAVADGVIYGTTNLGVCFAVDAESGEIRWLRGYDVIPLPQTRLRGQDLRPVYFANNPVVISDGVMACTPLDSEYVLGLDVDSGRLLWRQFWREGEFEVRWLLGELAGEFILSGKGILGITPRSGNARLSPKVRQIASAESLGENSNYAGYADGIPRGALSENQIYFLSSSKIFSILDSRGNRDPRSDDFQITGSLGNLFLTDGMMMVLSQGGVRSYGDLDAMRRLATRALAEGTRDPAAYMKVAALMRASADMETDGLLAERAEDLLQRGLELAAEQGQGANSPVYRKLAAALFEMTMDRAEKLRLVSPERALAQLYKARERALIPRHWLEAQVEILDLLRDENPEFLNELDQMASRYGHISFAFEDLGNLPVTAYCLWRGIAAAEADSAEIGALRCQDLLERYPDQQIGDFLAGDLAAARIARLIQDHGRGVYAQIETRAGATLTEAREDRNQLRALVKRFPHSQAAKQATGRLLDLAVRAGDLAAATAYYAEAIRRDQPSAGMMRRMMVAATRTGNHALATAFADRLLLSHANEASDFPSDATATYAEVVERAAATPATTMVAYRAPREQLSHLAPPNRDSTISYIAAEFVDGFANPSNPPLFISSNEETLHVFTTDPVPQSFADERFRLPLDRLGSSTIYICGELAVLCEDNLVRGVALEDGSLRWSKPSPMKRGFTSLGIRSGVLHLFSALNTQGDGGKLIGIEVLTGAELFTLSFPDDRSSIWPIAAQGFLWSLETLQQGKFAAILKMDPLNGKIVANIPISDVAIAKLGFDKRRHRLRDAEFQRRMFVDDRAIYLPLIEGDDGGPPRLVAINFEGEFLWDWLGRPDQSLAFEASHKEGIVLFEQGTASRLTVLDHNGQELYSNELGLYARLVPAQTGPVKRSAPDILLFANHRNDNQSASLTCWSLDRRGPRFIKEFRAGVQRVYRHPQLGDDFVTIPLLLENTRRPKIQVIDLKTRRGALPDGQSTPTVQKLRSPLTLYSHGAFTLLDTPQGITILGG